MLENDILIPEIFAIAQKHGFTDIRLKVLDDIEVSLNQYKLLTNQISQKLLNVIFRGVGNMMVNSTIFFLYKGSYIPDSRSHIGLSCSLSTERNVFSIKAGENLDILVRVTNSGSAGWLNENINDIGVVKIGTHLSDEAGRLLDLDYSRHDLPDFIEPGTTFEQSIKVRFSDPGTYKLAIDLVSEHICWFENQGSIPITITVNVE